MTNQKAHRPWYKEFWLWFVLAPPMASIALGLSLVAVAFTQGDTVVVDNYAQAGRALHKDNHREHAAREIGLDGTLVLDRREGQVTVRLDDLPTMPERLDLLLAHPTHAERDVKLTLERDSTGLYRGDARQAVEGRRYVRLQSGDGDWLFPRTLAADAGELSLDAESRSRE